MAISFRANVGVKEIDLPIGISIPSTGEVVKRVTVSAMTGHDEEMVSSRKVRNNGAKIVTALLAEKIVRLGDKDYPKGIGAFIARKMWSADRDTCLKEIRGLMADDMTVKPKCPTCGESDEAVIYMSQLEVREWGSVPNGSETKIVFDEPGVMMFELPDGLIMCDDESKTETVCKVGRIKLTDGVIEEQVAASGRENIGEANTSMLAACIVELENVRIVDSNVVQAMSKRDRDYLSRILRDGNPGPQFLQEHICPNCGEKFPFLLRLPDFFTA